MKFEFKIFIVLFLLSTSPFTAEAGKIKRGFEALKIHDYFKAKTSFEKGSKYHPSAAAFGLASVYSRNDNPFFSLDSAYKYIATSRTDWEKAKETRKLQWKPYGWSSRGIDSLRNQISSLMYLAIQEDTSIEAYSNFIQAHPWAREVTSAIYIRDSLAFFKTVEVNTAKSYETFLNQYPNSHFEQLARENYYDAQFEEITGKGTLASYQEFIRLNPENPLVVRAEKQIYHIVTESNSVEGYEAFIEKYPTNSFVPEAYSMLYETYIATDYSKERIARFLKEYPATPIQEKVERALDDETLVLLPVLVSPELGYGFMDTTGKLIEERYYDQLSSFNEGLAVFLSSETNKLGAVTKSGKVQIDPEFDEMTDFVNGLSIVSKNDLYGVIHRNGKYILECSFDDLGTFSEGLIFASKDGLYGYYDMNGRQRVDAKFEDAYDFSNGMAKVVFKGNEAFIDIYGTYIVPPVVEQISPFSDSLYIFQENGEVGLMDRLGRVALSANYEYIGRLNEGLSLVSNGETVFYMNKRGEVVIDDEYEVFPNYAFRGEFKDGAATVYKDEMYGRVNTSGKIVSEIKYDNLGISQDIIPFEKDGLWGALSFSNKVIIEAKYNTIEVQGDHNLIAQIDGLYGVLNEKGEEIVPFSFKEVIHLTEDIFVITDTTDHRGIFRNGTLKVPAKYQRISVFDKDFLLLSNDRLSYYDKNRDCIISMKQEAGE